jgi:hypothetical protein
VGRPQNHTLDRKIAHLAGRSHGVVSREELIRAGITAAEIRHRLASGALIPIHHGVFRVGHAAPSLEATYMAAVKAGGKGALLRGRAAAHLLGLLRGRPPRPEVLVTSYRRPAGVTVTRCRTIDRRDRTRWRGIPVTTVPRTIVDLASVLSEEDLARAFHQAAVLHRTTPERVEAVLSRRDNWPGRHNLRGVVWGETPVTLSRLEKRFIERLRADLAQPETNRHVNGRYIDCRWPHLRVTVELDSYRYHHTRYAWEQERQREREARARGDEFRRYTWRDVSEVPDPMLADLRELLSRRLPLAPSDG